MVKKQSGVGYMLGGALAFLATLLFLWVALLNLNTFVIQHQNDFYPSNFPLPFRMGAVTDWAAILAALVFLLGFVLGKAFKEIRQDRKHVSWLSFMAIILFLGSMLAFMVALLDAYLNPYVKFCMFFFFAGAIVHWIFHPAFRPTTHD